MKKIDVYRISDNKLVAGDIGESVTIESLNSKMDFDITGAEYQIIEKDLVETRESAREKGRMAKIACDNALAIINGYGQGLTEQQESDLMTNHGDALQLLQLNKAWTFKAYIEAIDPSLDSVITEEMKSNILEQLIEDGI